MSTESSREARVLAVTSGKGGVGKTHVTVNLAVAYAESGRQVLIVDGDMGMANVDILMNVTPHGTLRDVLNGDLTLDDVLVKTPLGPTILPGSNGAVDMAAMDDRARWHLKEVLAPLSGRFDTILVDTAAGIGPNTLFFAGAAQDAIVVVTPEPTSLADAYGVVKALSTRAGVDRLGVVVNQAEDKNEAREVFVRLAGVASQFLPVVLDFAGWIPRDRFVRESVMIQSPVLKSFPSAPASRALRELADRLLMRPIPSSGGRMQLFWDRMAGAQAPPGGAP